MVISKHSAPVRALALAAVSALAALPSWAAADFPFGAYTAKGLNGTVTFDNQGQLRVMQGGKLMVGGAYTVSGDKIQLTDKEGPWACTKAGEQTGAYRWKFVGGVMAFTKVADPCTVRAQSLTDNVWKKVTP